MQKNKYIMFKCSKPFGYYPPDVEQRIREYEHVLDEMNKRLSDLTRACSAKDQRIEKLQDELRAMHLQMASLELPEADEAIEHYILEDFKNYNSNNDQLSNPVILNNENGYNDNKTSMDENELLGFLNETQENDDSDGFTIIQ